MMRRFAIADLCVTADASRANVTKYLRALVAADYVRIAARSIPAHGAAGYAAYVLVSDSGPRPPRLHQYGPNASHKRLVHGGAMTRIEHINCRHDLRRVQNFFAQFSRPPASTAGLRALALQMIELAIEIDLQELAAMNKCDPTEILQTVSALCRVPLEPLRGRCRTQHVATARQLAMYLCRELSKLSFPAVARVFGRDHSTVIHGCRLIARRRLASEPFDRLVRDLIAKLESAAARANHAEIHAA